ncbi:MAG: T9SS type A sorting domain-containing protein [Candidatus Kapabacteria bacterium]|nr:T9SS type A sorting domain-containing protein [Candidatus Kapabacteria bacterium]
MKQIITSIFLITLAIIFTNLTLSSQPWLNGNYYHNQLKFETIQNDFNNYWSDKIPSKGRGWKQFKRLEYFLEQRLFPNSEIPNLVEIILDYEKLSENQKTDILLQNKADWKPLGPNRMPQKHPQLAPSGLGRINCVAFDPLNPNIIWAGAAFGGVWKTNNGGMTWQTFPFTEFLSIGISDIAVAPSNPNIVYAATGDANAAGVMGQNFGFSIGVIKTTNGGNTWSRTGLIANLNNFVLINRVLVNPTNPDIVVIASNAGVYASTNGGQNWTMLTNEYCRDLEFKPNEFATLYGAFITPPNTYTIKKFSTATNTWNKVLEFTDVSRIALTVSKANPNYVYAVAAAMDGGFHSFWLSTNSGNNWTNPSNRLNSPNILSFEDDGKSPGGQGFYDLCIAVSNRNMNEIYVGGINIWKSTDGGVQWKLLTSWRDNKIHPWVHADHHFLGYDYNNILFSCNDGGVQYSTNDGISWTDISNGLDVSQFYKINSSATNPNILIGGTQDNGTHIYGDAVWKNVQGGDGMSCLIDYSDPKYMYASLYYGEFTRSTNGGLSFTTMLDSNISKEKGAWVSPIVIHPTDPKILFVGLQNIWKSTDRGLTWNKISNFVGGNFRTLAVAPSNPNVIYAGAFNQMFRTTNGGTSWTEVFRAPVAITGIAVDPLSPMRFWLTFSGYNQDYKVYEFEGTQQTNIGDSLPNVPVNCIVYQKNSPGRMFIGTDIGVFTRDNLKPYWVPFNDGLPNVIVNDLEIPSGSGLLRAGTYGRGLWQTKIIDCNIPIPEISLKGNKSICEGDSVLIECTGNYAAYRWSNGETTKSIWVKTAGTYYVFVTDKEGCSARSLDITIEVNPAPEITLKATPSDNACEGENVEISGIQIIYTSIKWSTGETSRRITVTKPGRYSVTATTSQNCQRTAFIDITMKPAPEKPTITQSDNVLISSDAFAYQWYLDGSIIPLARSKTYTPKKDGYYQVEITNQENCKNISDKYYFKMTSVEENIFSDNKFFYPNPTDNTIFIRKEFLQDKEFNIKIFNLTGLKVFEYNHIGFIDNDLMIDTEKLNSGIYILQLNISGKIIVDKLLINK